MLDDSEPVLRNSMAKGYPFGSGRICAVVAGETSQAILGELRQSLRYTRTVELRLDWLRSEDEFRKLTRALRTHRPHAVIIATCRRKQAGGKFQGSIREQLRWFEEAVAAGCQWFDCEIESASPSTRVALKRLTAVSHGLLSLHKFRGTPSHTNLERVQRRMRHEKMRAGFRATKIALACHSLNDAVRVLNLAGDRRNMQVVVPMGEIATAARILALREGSALAYALVENATAPGQLSLEEMKQMYRADKLDRKTSIYGVIGDPIAHSLSPRLHNAGFQARRVNAVYLPFLTNRLGEFLQIVKTMGILGFSVTLPHKERILRYMDDCDPLARAIGAVNTVVVRKNMKLYGYNTDYVGVLRALERRMPIRDSRVLIFGAGGAARAVAFALAQAGAQVCVCARKPFRAENLAKAVGGEAIPRPRLRRDEYDAIVNATPVGMYPNQTESPLEAEELNCRLVFDTIYRPRETQLLRLAARRGIETISGVEMFLAQGLAQWEIWMGERAPEQQMRRAVVEALRREEEGRRRG